MSEASPPAAPSAAAAAGSEVPAAQLPNFSRWDCIWPIYLDSTKTVAEGRRVAAQDGVASPNLIEVAEALVQNGYTTADIVIEQHKAYPRDFLLRGRVRVKLHDADKKRHLLRSLGQTIQRMHPKRPSPAASGGASPSPSSAAASRSKNEAAAPASSSKKGRRR